MVNIFKFCKKYLKQNKKMLIVYGFLCLVSSVFSMVSPYISGNFIDYLTHSKAVKLIFVYCILFLFITIVSQTIGYFLNRIYTKLQTKMGFELNSDVLRHIEKLSMTFIKNQDMAYLNQRINNDSNMIVTFCINIVQGILINSLKLLLTILLLLSFSKTIGILLALIIFLYVVIYIVLRKRLFIMKFMLTESQATYFAKLYEQLNNMIFIKTQAIYSTFISRLKKEFSNVFKVTLHYQRISYAFSSLDSLVMSIAQIGIFIMGGIAVIKGGLSIGQLTIMLSYFSMMMDSIRYFFSLTKMVQDNKVAFVRLSEILSQAYDENGGERVKKLNCIEVKNISFSYSDKQLLKNFSCKFEKGNLYSIIGHNGKGKTTLINLILGFYRNTYKGEICFNGISLNKLDSYNIRKTLFGVSEQEPVLLFDTIEYNILLDEIKEIDAEKVFDLAEKLALDVFLKELPEGLSTFINDKNSNLSGGEKQKLSILRTLYKDPDVIILDEPTSALDIISSACLKNYLGKLKENKIILIITHNKEFLSISDGIIDLDDF